MVPSSAEDQPARGLREEDDDDHAGSTDAGDAHHELLQRISQEETNEAG